MSSMASDIAQHRRTEIDFINGYIVEMGHRMGIKTPANQYLTSQVKEIESFTVCNKQFTSSLAPP